MAEPLIVLKDLSKKFGKKIATNRISMSVGRGEIFGFLGANGAGKTTTIRMLCGLTKPTSGTGSIGRTGYLERSIPDPVAIWIRAPEIQPLFRPHGDGEPSFFWRGVRRASERNQQIG